MRYSFLFLSLLLFFSWENSFAQLTHAQVIKGVAAFEEGDFSQAAIQLEKALSAAADTIDEESLLKAHFYLAQAYFEDWASLPQSQKDNRKLQQAVKQLLLTREKDQAAIYETLVIQTTELIWPSLYNAGTHSYNNKNYSEAITWWEYAEKLRPNTAKTALSAGYAHWKRNDTLNALEQWERVLTADNRTEEEQIEGHRLLIETYRLIGEKEISLQKIKDAVKHFPNTMTIRKAEAQLYVDFPDLAKESENTYVNLIDNKENKGARWIYGILLKQQGMIAEAKNSFQELLADDPSMQEAHEELGQLFFKSGDFTSALPHFQFLHQQEPQNIQWIDGLIRICQELNLPEKKEYKRLRRDWLKNNS